ncbi:MBOAT family O-acyltransferase [Paenibacillus sp. HJGM_3]|uniref:MBOAT family O-acyltransferase n=1 Tax=Paenibacillus sp. HJGM_3 TaxID=3379816 RepID=UPI00385C1E32
MIFSSIDYLVFMVGVIVLLIIIKSGRVKKTILLLSSYYFYSYWDYRFVALMFLMTVVNFFIGKKIEESNQEKGRKLWLLISVFFNLCVLGYFKYYNFFIESANNMLDSIGVRFSLLDIILPVGISFITFEVMSYTIDIYRKTGKSADSFGDFALLVAFFPHLIAGPILKPSHFLPQLKKEIRIRWVNVEIGVQIFLFGMLKKVLIADRLALFVDPVFKDSEVYSSFSIWLAVIAYAIQIYCDFSGYTDMAIGSAKCLGFEIPHNFNMPYISRSMTEFWKRWHISLSSWLREYLYISLGGNRKGKVRQLINLSIVMLLGGLWHGASWNFVIWGGLHGIALVAHKLYLEYILRGKEIHTIVYKTWSWLVTVTFVCLTWVFFRSPNIDTAMYIIKKLLFFTPDKGILWIPTSFLLILPLIVVCHIFGKRKKGYAVLKLTTFSGLFVFFFVLLGLLFLMPVSFSPFIYFQF